MDLSFDPQFAAAIERNGVGALRPVSYDGLVARLAVDGEVASIRLRSAGQRSGRTTDRKSLDARIDLFGGPVTDDSRHVAALGAFFPAKTTGEDDVNPSGSTNVKSEADILPKSDVLRSSIASEDCSEAARGME